LRFSRVVVSLTRLPFFDDRPQPSPPPPNPSHWLDLLPSVAQHLVTCLAAEMDATPPTPGGAASAAATGADARAASALVVLRALIRLAPRCSTGLLLSELAKGRLMEGIRRAFLSSSTDVRRAVVGILVEVALVLAPTNAFARYAEAHLTLPQQKLLQI
jgi:hypothetical protein